MEGNIEAKAGGCKGITASAIARRVSGLGPSGRQAEGDWPMAGISRPRITALLNRRRRDISTDLMFRVLASLGYSAKLSLKKSPDSFSSRPKGIG